MGMNPEGRERQTRIYFSDFFEVDPAALDGYGAFKFSLIVDGD